MSPLQCIRQPAEWQASRSPGRVRSRNRGAGSIQTSDDVDRAATDTPAIVADETAARVHPLVQVSRWRGGWGPVPRGGRLIACRRDMGHRRSRAPNASRIRRRSRSSYPVASRTARMAAPGHGWKCESPSPHSVADQPQDRSQQETGCGSSVLRVRHPCSFGLRECDHCKTAAKHGTALPIRVPDASGTRRPAARRPLDARERWSEPASRNAKPYSEPLLPRCRSLPPSAPGYLNED